MSLHGTSITPESPFENDGPIEAALSGFPVAQEEVVETSHQPSRAMREGTSRTSFPTEVQTNATVSRSQKNFPADRSPHEKREAPQAEESGSCRQKPGNPALRANFAVGEREVFGETSEGRRSFTKYAPIGRARRTIAPFKNDLAVGKFGVLDPVEADALEAKLFASFGHDGLMLGGRSQALREDFLRALHLFLAINSGSIGNVVGRMGVRDDSQPLQFGDVQVAAADVAGILGDRAYSYMRSRATEIRDTIEAAVTTSLLPEAETQFPGVCNAVDLIKTVAATKGLSQYPQYVAVGSQYASGTPPYVIAAINESSSKVLATTSGNVRASDVAMFGDHHE